MLLVFELLAGETASLALTATTRRLVRLLKGNHAELLQCLQAAMRRAAETATTDTETEAERVYEVLNDQLANEGVAQSVGLAGVGSVDFGTQSLRDGLAAVLSERLQQDLVRMGVDPGLLMEAFATEATTAIIEAGTRPESELTELANRLQASRLQAGQDRLARRLGMLTGSAAERLELMAERAVDRLRRGLEALGLTDVQVQGLLVELICRPADISEGRFVWLTGDVGVGKTTTAIQAHLDAIDEAADDSSRAPLPVYRQAGEIDRRLEDVVIDDWQASNIQARGIHLIVDELDRVGSGRAQALTSEVAAHLRRCPHSRAIIVSRPLDINVPGEVEKHSVAPLERDQAKALIERISGRSVHLPTAKAVRDAIRAPLFAIVYATARVEEALSTGPQIARVLVDRALDAADIADAEHLLQRAAAAALDASHHQVALAEVTSSVVEKDALVRSRVVQIEDGFLRWPVALLAEHFAAHHLIEEPDQLESRLEDRELAERWRYAIVWALNAGPTQALDELLQRLVKARPALAGWAINQHGSHFAHDRDRALRPTSLQAGRRIYNAMSAFADALGPLGPRVTPMDKGALTPLYVSVEGAWLNLAWGKTASGDEVVEVTDRSQRPPVRGTRGTVMGDTPAWPWQLVFDQVRKELHACLESRRLLVGPQELILERDYHLATAVLGKRTIVGDPIAVADVENRISGLAEYDDGSILQQKTHRMRLGDLRELVARCRDSGRDTIRCPWPGADASPASWVHGLWTEDSLRDRVEQVTEAGLATYRTTVSRWLSAFAEDLEIFQTWPGAIYIWFDPGDPAKGVEGWPTFLRAVVPPADDEPRVRRVSEAEQAHDEAWELGADRVYGDGLPGLYGPTPLQDLATRMLWEDLHMWAWVQWKRPTTGTMPSLEVS